jgi:hypothetical protein
MSVVYLSYSSGAVSRCRRSAFSPRSRMEFKCRMICIFGLGLLWPLCALSRAGSGMI